MKRKRIIALVLAVSFLFSGFSLNGNVSDFRRTVEGCVEIVVRAIRSTFGVRSYTGYEELYDIPEIENGYVPQGYCFSESRGLHFISYYQSKKASVISLVDAESGIRVKTLNLAQADGSDFKGHAGGIAEDGRFFYVVDGKEIYRADLNVIEKLSDGDKLILSEKILTDVKCSYLNSDGKYLYAGEFYSFTTDGSYDTDKSHHMAISLFETTYARCNAYLISDIEGLFSETENDVAVPALVFTTPNCVQGFTRMNDGSIVLSISYGRDNNSSLAYYSDVTKGNSDFTVEYGEASVPAYHLNKADRNRVMRLPPLLEGIDDMNGNVVGIFESCAEKYSDSAFVVEEICVFS